MLKEFIYCYWLATVSSNRQQFVLQIVRRRIFIQTEIKKRLKHQSQIITIILRPSPSSSILHPLRRPFLRSKDKRSKRSTAVDSQGQRCLKRRRLVRRVTMLCGASCTAGATPGGFFERCGCSHPTRQKSV